MSRACLTSPFGSPDSFRDQTHFWSDASEEYRYGFNDKEKDFETANYDFPITIGIGARIYDSRLGRSLSLVPNLQIGMSDYSVLGNDSILNINEKGNCFVDRYSRRQIRKQIHETKCNLKYQGNQLKEINKTIDDDRNCPERSGSITADLLKRSYIQLAIDELNDALREIEVMKASYIPFRIECNRKRGNGTAYRDQSVVTMVWNGKGCDILTHELEHGYQYLTGEIDFNEMGGSGPAYDINDETDAYRRQIAYSSDANRTLVFIDEVTEKEEVLSYRNLTNDNVRNLLPSYKDLPEKRLKSESPVIPPFIPTNKPSQEDLERMHQGTDHEDPNIIEPPR